jgi:hypothetical protein
MGFYCQARKSATVTAKLAIRVTSERSNAIAMNSRTDNLALIAESDHTPNYVLTKTPILGRQAVRRDQLRTPANLLLRTNAAFNKPGVTCKASLFCPAFMLPAPPTVPTDRTHKTMTPPQRTRLTMETMARATQVPRIPRRRQYYLLLVKVLHYKRVINQRDTTRTCQREQHRQSLLSQRLLRPTCLSIRRI